MLISNYGLFWRTEHVFWGKQKQPGELNGVLSAAKKSDPIDFRYQAGIYALYGDYELVYLGQTGGKGQKLMSRLNQHRKDSLSGRWNMFSWFGTRAVLESGKLKAEKGGAHSTHQAVLNHMEAVLISVAEPRLNRQGGKWGKGVEKYLQVPDERLEKHG
jgi:hypothetical protein